MNEHQLDRPVKPRRIHVTNDDRHIRKLVRNRIEHRSLCILRDVEDFRAARVDEDGNSLACACLLLGDLVIRVEQRVVDPNFSVGFGLNSPKAPH